MSPAPPPALFIAERLAARYQGAAVFLYGSGISVSANEDPTTILFDYYVIVKDYRSAVANPLLRFAARALPPNVYYFEDDSSAGTLRAKYALLSIDALETLVSKQTFHSYFWARFAQPMRLVVCPDNWRARLVAAVRRSIETFLQNAQGLAGDPCDWRAVWLAGMNASYRAELRAEAPGRAEKLIESYGDWPMRVAAFGLDPAATPSARAHLAWRARAVIGGLLSVARLLKATATFQGGLDYIAWKVKRHAGIDVAVEPWERRLPFLAAPFVAMRYYRLRAAKRRHQA